MAFGHRQVFDAHALEVGALAGQEAKARLRQTFAKQVALALVEGAELKVRRRVGHVRGQRVLHRRVDSEHVELVHFAELGGQRRWRDHGTDFPAGDVVGLAEAADDEGAGRQARKARGALVQLAIKDHVLIHLVADQQHLGRCQQRFQLSHVLSGPHLAAGVVRAVDQDRTGARRDRSGDGVEVRPEAARHQRHAHHLSAGQLDVGHVAVVAGFEHDHLVARVHDRQDGGQDGLGRAGGDGDLGVRVAAEAVQRLHLGGHGLAQRGHAGHGWVLVVAGLHGAGHGVDQFGITVEIGESLPEVDRADLGREGRHDAENGGADGGQARGQRGRSWRQEGVAGGVHGARQMSYSVASPAIARRIRSRESRSLISSAKRSTNWRR